MERNYLKQLERSATLQTLNSGFFGEEVLALT
jgi:hypothetical protein